MMESGHATHAPWIIFLALQETMWSSHSSPSPLELVYVVDGPSKKKQTREIEYGELKK